MMTSTAQATLRATVVQAIRHLDHVLPGQAPIHDFVHHNTLHGFQHLSFEQAITEFEALTGIQAYWPPERFRELYRQGRIDDHDLDWAWQQAVGNDQQPNLVFGVREVPQSLWIKALLLSDCRPLTPAALPWRLAQLSAAEQASWQALQTVAAASDRTLDMAVDSAMALRDNFAGVGEQLSLRGLLRQLTGQDVLDNVRPYLIRSCAAVLDEGMAAWSLPDWQTRGWFWAWKQGLNYEANGLLQDLHDFNGWVQTLADDPVDAIIQQLQAFAIPESRWGGYLQRLVLELPGWSGLINWREQHPDYQGGRPQPGLADYLAIRLVLDRCYLADCCKRHQLPVPRLDRLQQYFERHPEEWLLRRALYAGDLPEAWMEDVRQTLADQDRSQQQALAAALQQWQSAHGGLWAAHDGLWRLFAVCRQLELSAEQIAAAPASVWSSQATWMAAWPVGRQSLLWLNAYEHHYQQQLLQALHANDQRGRWADRHRQRPEAQVIFCMDDREEGMRRHLEEHNPWLETLGAAGFFGIAMHYRGLDDSQTTALCPVVVNPAHVIEERASAPSSRLLKHQRGQRWQRRLAALLYHGMRREAVLAYPLLPLLAPWLLASLVLRSVWPLLHARLMQALQAVLSPELETHLQVDAEQPERQATPESPRQGFNDVEQAERVAAFLRNTGLTYGFAPLIVLMGHGSGSRNNPHLAAYDCGACSGRHGGPNARAFAAMINRPVIRQHLAVRGIVIPDDTWFIGAEHNTADESLTFYDLAQLPVAARQRFTELEQQLQHACHGSAHERCRRLASAPRRPSFAGGLRHFRNRVSDFSQARPELGHATNAAAFIGRRSQTQGVFFDRRLFLISYDPTQDADGAILEGILLAVGPVGAGINLEYYFSTVNNEQLGCGSKVPHNLTGFVAVMEGASSDLRTGLPKQMVEIHEAMRLQLVVETTPAILTQIYARQPALQELIGGGWVHLSCKDPVSGQIYIFKRGVGFVLWSPMPEQLPVMDSSPDCYQGSQAALPPMLIRQAFMPGVSL